jgi:ubiquinone/menaquinone biosynthesis C-methylase UbiE
VISDREMALLQWRQALEASAYYQGLLSGEEERYWERCGEEYYRNRTRGTHYSEVLQLLLAAIPPGVDLLEVGPGPGIFTLPLARHCAQVTAVDSSPAVCSLLREKAEGLENLRVIQDTWEEADVPRHDLVLAAGVLHVFLDLASALEKMIRIAKRRVILVIVQDDLSLLYALTRELRLPPPQGKTPSMEIIRNVLKGIVSSWSEIAVSGKQVYRYADLRTLETLWGRHIPLISRHREELTAFLGKQGLLSAAGEAVIPRFFQTTVICLDTIEP